MNKMMKRTISLLVVLSLTVSMLTGCAFLVPFIQKGAEAVVTDRGDEHEKSDNNDELSQEKSIMGYSASINELLGTIYETEYQQSSFIQEDVESETVQWICATYALYNQANGKEVTRISGLENLTLANQEIQDALQEKMKIHIWEAWGIDNRKTFVEKSYALLNKERPVDEAKELLGWDLSRANQMIGDAYYVKFINLEECLDLSLLLSREIQSNYSSWEELSESHLEGLQRLKSDNPKDLDSDSGKRLTAYEELKVAAQKGEGPYALPFDMELTKSWDAVTAEANKDKRETNEAEEDELGSEETVQDEDGRIAVHGYGEEGPRVKLRIPVGFAEGSYSYKTYVAISDVDSNVEIIYSIRRLYGEQTPKEWMEEEIQFELEFDSNASVIAQHHEGDDNEAIFYFGIEAKDFYDAGNSLIEYYGYYVRKIDGEWEGLYSRIQTDSKANVSEEEAAAWLFPDVQWP